MEKKKKISELTLRELEKNGINRFSDIGAKDGVTLNLSWAKAIRLINYLCGKGTISWEDTSETLADKLSDQFEKLFNLTIEEMDQLKIQLSDIICRDGVTLNITWDKLIRLVNYTAGAGTVSWKSTVKDASEKAASFL